MPLFSAALPLFVALGFADPSRWVAPRSCPSAEVFDARLRAEGCEDAKFRLSIKVVKDSRGFRANGQVTTSERRETLELSHPSSCAALLDKIAVHLAPLCLPTPALPADPPPRPRVRAHLGATADVDVGSLRKCDTMNCGALLVAPGATVFGGFSRRRQRFEFAVPMLTTSSDYSAQAPFGKTAARWIVTGGQFRFCRLLARQRFDLAVCGDVGIRVLLGHASNADTHDYRARNPYLVWGVVRLALAATWWMHWRLGLRLEATPGVHLHGSGLGVREQYVYEPFDFRDERELIRVGYMHFQAGLGLVLRGGRK